LDIIRALEGCGNTEYPPIHPRQRGCPIPLTALQSRWLRWCGKVQKRAFSGPKTVSRVRGALDVDVLRLSLNEILKRHESLRIRVVEFEGTLYQEVDEIRPFAMEFIDLSVAFSKNDSERNCNLLFSDFFEEEVDVGVGPLCAARLIKINSQEYALALALHHIGSDAISTDIVHRDIWTSYSQLLEGITTPHLDLPIQFPDYAIWQALTYDTWFRRHSQYWRDRLTGTPATVIPSDTVSAKLETPVGEHLFLQFSDTLSDELRKVAQREKTLLALVVLTIYVVCMSHWLSQSDLLVVFQSNGRFRPELENIVGFVTSLHHLRITAEGGATLEELLHRVANEFYAAYDHFDFDRVPDLLPELNTDLALSWTPVRGERLANRTYLANSTNEIHVESFPYLPDSGERFGVYAFDGAAGVYFSIAFRPDSLSRSAIERFRSNLIITAERFARQPLARVSEIDLQ